MLGKRPRPTMRRTSSVSLIGSGSVNGDSSPLPEHPKEKLMSTNSTPVPSSCAPRQVIGFHPKVFIDEELELGSPISPRLVAPQSSKSPSGSPRSGLGDLLAGGRPWDRKEEGVGLSIVAALSGSQEDVGKAESRGFSSPGVGYARKTTSPQANHHLPSVFAPSRASPPIPIIPPPFNCAYRCPAHCSHQNCAPPAFELPSSMRPESLLLESLSSHRGGGSRPNSSSSSTVTWTRTIGGAGGAANNPLLTWGQLADMEVDRNEPHSLVSSPAAFRHGGIVVTTPSPSQGFIQNFLDACHLCRRRLGDRDIYMYRGDRAFCSPECRHQQILNDERPEKCSSAVMKMGGGPETRSSTQRNRVAGTAAAA